MKLIQFGDIIVNVEQINHARREKDRVILYLSADGQTEAGSLILIGRQAQQAWSFLEGETALKLV